MPKPHEVLQPEAVAPEVVKPGVTRAATSAAEVVLCFMFIALFNGVSPPLRTDAKLLCMHCPELPYADSLCARRGRLITGSSQPKIAPEVVEGPGRRGRRKCSMFRFVLANLFESEAGNEGLLQRDS